MSQITLAQAVEIGLKHHHSGQLQEAEAIYRQILTQDPNNADVLHLLGVIAHQCNHHLAAIDLIQKSLSIQPRNVSAYTNLGEAFRALGRLDEAGDAARKAIELKPDSGEAYGNLGLVWVGLGKIDEAIHCYKKAIALNPKLAQNFSNLGNALMLKKETDAALAEYDRALAVDPDFSEGHNNRGSALEKLDRLEEAMVEYERAFELRPTFAVAANNAGNIERRLCRWDKAMIWCQRALQIDPALHLATWNAGLLQLTQGDYASGLPKYEHRFVTTPNRLPEGITKPRWDGSPLNGKTVLLYAEQGLGDGWQAARYIPMIAARGGKIALMCIERQVGLLKNLEGVIGTFVAGEPWPAHDFFLPMMSLPLIFNTTIQTIPREVPYLKPDPDRIKAWRDRLSAFKSFKVGLVWNGSEDPDPLRSIAFSELAPLASVAGVEFFSLQFGPAAADAKKAAAWMNVVDLSADVADFGESAACMMNLDLILTVDTAAAHLAGALGRPTWTLIPFSPDWRWHLDREDSVWYPTMRLFRQTKRRVWTDVIERVVKSLRETVSSHGLPRN